MAVFYNAKDGEIEYCDRKLLLYGNGPHTRVIYGYLHELSIFSGFIVDDHVVHNQAAIGDFLVTPLSRAITEFPPDKYAVIVALGFRDFNNLRKDRSQVLKSLGYRIASFVDKSVRLPRSYSISENCIIIDHVSLNDGVSIEDGAFVSSGAMLGHDSLIKSFSWIGSGAALAGGVTVGESSILGLNCSIKQNTNLGHHSLVFPNTFVNADTAPYNVIASEAGRRLPYDSRRMMKFAFINSGMN
jgi:acetyltransferase-like isoleucine patch superfamily enzyme